MPVIVEEPNVGRPVTSRHTAVVKKSYLGKVASSDSYVTLQFASENALENLLD